MTRKQATPTSKKTVRPLCHDVKRDRITGLKRLLRLADGLETMPEPAFDYNMVMGIPIDGGKAPLDALKAGGSCGTAGCAIGWAPSILPKVLAWAPSGTLERDGSGLETLRVHLLGHVGWVDYTCVCQSAFALTYDEADYLFTPGSPHPTDGRKAPPETASAKRVAEHIRRWATAELKKVSP